MPSRAIPPSSRWRRRDVAYLCDAANRYFRERIETVDVVRTLSGANMVMKPRGRLSPRDGAMTLDHGRGKAPLITVFGGDVTTSRLRAERAVSRLTPFYPMSARWTAKAPLPGGDFAWDRFDNEVDEARERWRFLGEDQARRSGRRLWVERQGDPWRRQGAQRPRPGLRTGIDGRRSALSHAKGMGALSG